ncbi:hypothetical protein H1P_1820012 [Hyella patelloides LEGE 07179]|uniref:Uncharacterized protein n=1 Tax=Hyella patelloides LEGE 07179 TaxID=945734 RepID=A0A563VNU8_9CYAN|nr:hypothetical protein H1P_1820012 [Hyella patelloides LEGE 07179]
MWERYIANFLRKEMLKLGKSRDEPGHIPTNNQTITKILINGK